MQYVTYWKYHIAFQYVTYCILYVTCCIPYMARAHSGSESTRGARVRIWRASPLSRGLPACPACLEAVPAASHKMLQGLMHANRHGISSSWPVAAWTCSNVDLW